MSDVNGNPRKILLKGQINYDEYVANGNITPGMLVMLSSVSLGGVLTPEVVVHNTAGYYAAQIWAIEFPLNESLLAGGNAGSIDTVVAAGQLCAVHFGCKGDKINAFIKANQNIVPGDLLVSAGDGTLEKYTSLSTTTLLKQPIAICETAINLTATGAVATRTPVRLL